MKLHLKAITAIVLGSVVYSTSALAAYGPAPAPAVHKPCPWSISVGYGQTFGHDKATASVKTFTPTTVTYNTDQTAKVYAASTEAGAYGFINAGTADAPIYVLVQNGSGEYTSFTYDNHSRVISVETNAVAGKIKVTTDYHEDDQTQLGLPSSIRTYRNSWVVQQESYKYKLLITDN